MWKTPLWAGSRCDQIRSSSWARRPSASNSAKICGRRRRRARRLRLAARKFCSTSRQARNWWARRTTDATSCVCKARARSPPTSTPRRDRRRAPRTSSSAAICSPPKTAGCSASRSASNLAARSCTWKWTANACATSAFATRRSLAVRVLRRCPACRSASRRSLVRSNAATRASRSCRRTKPSWIPAPARFWQSKRPDWRGACWRRTPSASSSASPAGWTRRWPISSAWMRWANSSAVSMRSAR